MFVFYDWPLAHLCTALQTATNNSSFILGSVISDYVDCYRDTTIVILVLLTHRGRSLLPLIAVSDFNARGLAGGAVQRHVEDVGVGGPVLHLPDDVRQLRPVQPARRHPGRRIRHRGRSETPSTIPAQS